MNPAKKYQLLAAGAAILCIAIGLTMAQAFLRAYLVGFLLLLGIPLGSLALLMLHNLVGGGWIRPIRSLLEAAASLTPWFALLFLPVLAGLSRIYPWAAGDSAHLPAHLQAYYRHDLFIARAAVYFLIWSCLAVLVPRLTRQVEDFREPRDERRLRILSAIGLILYAMTSTFAAIDWAMSLDPHWISPIYGISFMVGQVLLALAFMSAAAIHASQDNSNIDALHDLGNLILAFLMLWGYTAFSQYLIIYSANLPEETPYYIRRLSGGWQTLGAVLIIGHFFVPFTLLLNRGVKRTPHLLMKVCFLIILMRLLDHYWLLIPSREDHGGSGLHWLDVLLPPAMGGLWIIALSRMHRRMTPPAPIIVEAA